MVQCVQDFSKVAVLPVGVPPRPKLSGPGRRTAPRLRVFFLRHFRACGEVKQAAERTGVAVSTLYRWRDSDESFRKRWDSLAEQRRQAVEDRLMGFVLEGERTAVFYKGEQVGWRYSHTARAAIAALAYFDRREKARRAEAQDRMRERALASRSQAAPEPKEAVKSTTSPAPTPRKTGNGQMPPAFHRDRVPGFPFPVSAGRSGSHVPKNAAITPAASSLALSP